MNIEQLLRECDRLASRYYRLDSGSRERAARDWMQLKVRRNSYKIRYNLGLKNPK
jgi:TPR repeat protein